MKKGMRFQSKLMLTMIVTITAVTIALLTATERKIRQAYTRQFEGEFQELIGQMSESRKARAEESLKLGSKLALHPYVVSILKGSEDDSELSREFWTGYINTLRELEGMEAGPLTGMGRRPGGNNGARPNGMMEHLFSRVGMVATMSLTGEVTLVTPSFGENGGPQKNRWKRFNYNLARDEIESFIRKEGQQVLYIAVSDRPDSQNTENGGKGGKSEGNGKNSGGGKTKSPKEVKQEIAREFSPLVQEMISTPVKDPETGELLGLFLRGTSAETDAQRFIERYQSALKSRAPLRNGIYLEGEIHSRSLEPEFAEQLSGAVEEALSDGTGQENYRWEGELNGMLHAVYVAPLTDRETPNPAYEVAAFSLTKLKSDLAELRIRGSGIGIGIMLFGILMAYLLARNLAVPLKELSKGTEAIRSGSLDARVKVRSDDEIGELADSFNQMAEELKQKDLYRDLLGKVSDETVAQALVSGSLDLELGGELKTVSVLFCDIRGFTAMTEHMDPTRVIEMVNTHMTAMTQIVRNHFGVVDKFVGDEIMAVFGGLKSYGNDAANAAACALDMIRVREELNQSLDVPIDIGVGVATGEAVAGCMGSTDRLNFTVLGARVNLAARLCGVASTMQVVIDRNTLDALGDTASAETLPDLELRGFTNTWSAFNLKSISAEPDTADRQSVVSPH